jgi:hypothetical protein
VLLSVGSVRACSAVRFVYVLPSVVSVRACVLLAVGC